MRFKLLLLSFFICMQVCTFESCATKKKVVDDEELEKSGETEAKPAQTEAKPKEEGATKKEPKPLSEGELVDGIIDREKERQEKYEEYQKMIQQKKVLKRMKKSQKKSRIYNSYNKASFWQRLRFRSRK